MGSERLHLREAVNVPDALRRDRLVRRLAELRHAAMQGKADAERWNRTHPHEEPLDTAFEEAVIAWTNGEGLNPCTEPSGGGEEE